MLIKIYIWKSNVSIINQLVMRWPLNPLLIRHMASMLKEKDEGAADLLQNPYLVKQKMMNKYIYEGQ